MALRCLKAALNADCDGQAGLQELAGNATMLFYMTEEGQEGRNAFNEKRRPDFNKFPATRKFIALALSLIGHIDPMRDRRLPPHLTKRIHHAQCQALSISITHG